MSSLDDRKHYGSMRLWGAVSFGIFSFLGGFLTTLPSTYSDEYSHGSPFRYLFFIYSFFCFCTGVLAASSVYHKHLSKRQSEDALDASNEPLTSEGDGEPDRPISTEPVSDGIVQSLILLFRKDYYLSIFCLVVFLSGCGAGVIDAFLFLRLKQLGGSGLVMGMARFVTCAAEVPMFQSTAFLLKRLGTWPLLVITQLAFVVRFLYYSILIGEILRFLLLLLA